ncbi:MAG: hypothetical protein KDD64_01405 [Bdellovibrionales bacterium]|nr:hypothetical protein [Bdellovibrionales bacterium]
MRLDDRETWRIVPPEEKLVIMAKAHASGTAAVAALLLVAGTLAVGFQQMMVFWIALLSSPIIFQFSASRKWKYLRPKAMLEYLAARSAARRYAFAVKATDLTLSVIFRGSMEIVYEQNDAEGILSALDAAISNNAQTEVWISLFDDALIMMSEQRGGAQLEFGHVINDRLSIELDPSTADLPGPERAYILGLDQRSLGMYRVRLRSPYPAALSVFYQRLQQLIQQPRAERIDFEKAEKLDLGS